MHEFVITIRTDDVRAAFEAGFKISEVLNELPDDVEWSVDVRKA